MILDVIVEQGLDGYTASVPSLAGCEAWGARQDEAIDNVLEMVRFYTKLPQHRKLKLDLARSHNNTKVFKLVFEK